MSKINNQALTLIAEIREEARKSMEQQYGPKLGAYLFRVHTEASKEAWKKVWEQEILNAPFYPKEWGLGVIVPIVDMLKEE